MIRERAACGLAQSGMFSVEQRRTAVPRLLDFAIDGALDAETRTWVFQALRDLTGQSLLPDAAEYDRGTYRACNRPMTPDGPPILGIAKHDNLYINSGHGHMGFTMACGSSRIVADLIDGRKTEIPVEGLTLTSRP